MLKHLEHMEKLSFVVTTPDNGRVTVQVRNSAGIVRHCINEGDADSIADWQVWEGFSNLSNPAILEVQSRKLECWQDRIDLRNEIRNLRNELARLVPAVLELTG